MRLVQPVILPARLRVAVGLIACPAGFVEGKVMIVLSEDLKRQWEAPAITTESVEHE
jgi:hypothetical protein